MCFMGLNQSFQERAMSLPISSLLDSQFDEKYKPLKNTRDPRNSQIVAEEGQICTKAIWNTILCI